MFCFSLTQNLEIWDLSCSNLKDFLMVGLDVNLPEWFEPHDTDIIGGNNLGSN